MTEFENIQLEYRKDVKYISNAEIEKYLLKEQIDEHSRRFKELKDAFEKRSIGRKSFYNWRLQSQTDSPAIQAKPEASANKQRHGAGSKGEVDFDGIEIKASRYRAKKTGQVALFSQVPNWHLSSLKSSGDILRKHGRGSIEKQRNLIWSTVSLYR